MALTLEQEIQQLYIGYLGRAADKGGLEYWRNDIQAGNITLEQVRANFVNEQPEYALVYGGLSRADMVAAIYENLFEREFDPVGFDYWVNGEGSTVNADQLIVAFLDAAGPGDRAVLDAKLEIAGGYTEIAGYDHYGRGSAIIADVDGTDATFESAMRLLISASDYLSAPSTPDDAQLVGIMQNNPGQAETVVEAGRAGEPDVFMINAHNFDYNGDHVVLSRFEVGDALFFGQTYTYRANSAPSAGDDAVLEIFVQQQGDDVLMTAEANPAGSGVLEITVVGITVAEMVPTTVV